MISSRIAAAAPQLARLTLEVPRAWLSSLRWERSLVGLAVLVHLLMMGSLFWGYLNSLSFSSAAPRGVDFFAVWEAGSSALHNESLYDFDLDDPITAPYSAPYRYVPLFAYAVGVPANAASPWWAYWGWVAFSELLLVANVYVTWRIAPNRSLAAVGASMWLLFYPFYLEVHKGQFSFLMASALLWTGIGVARGAQMTAAAPWWISLVTKSNTALLAPVFVRLAWWRALVGAGALALVNVPYFLWRPGDFTYFLDKNASFLASGERKFLHPWPADHGGLSFIHHFLQAFDLDSGSLEQALTVVLAVAVLGLSLWATFLRKVDPLALFAIWVAAFFLFYGFVWEFHYVMLLPVLVLLALLRPEARPWALVVFVFLAVPTPYWLLNNVWNTGPVPEGWQLFGIQSIWPTWGVVLYHGVRALPVAALWGYLVWSQLVAGDGLLSVAELRDRLRSKTAQAALS